jgi:hypothetical protein
MVSAFAEALDQMSTARRATEAKARGIQRPTALAVTRFGIRTNVNVLFQVVLGDIAYVSATTQMQIAYSSKCQT